MYNQDSIDEIKSAYEKFIRYFVIGTVIFVAILVLVCINWGTATEPRRVSVYYGYVAGVIYAVAAVFSWQMIGMRISKYNRFVVDIVTGLDHSISGVIQSIGQSPVSDNDLEYYPLEIDTDEDEENRIIYLDATKDISQLTVGQKVELLIHNRYIKDILK